MSKNDKLIGKKYGKLTVVSFHSSVKSNIFWNCICECGKTKITYTSNLNKGCCNSCGCLYKKQIKPYGVRSGRKRIYRIWATMIQRCHNPNCNGYSGYGGRGIQVCEKWRNNFLDFLSDVGDPPIGKQLDRIDVNGNYEPCNVRWVTPKEQGNNKRNTLKVTYKGITKKLCEWSEETGISQEIIRQRINVYGWDIEKALSTPKMREKK